MTSSKELIEDFLASEYFAVCGASSDRAKYGNIVLRALIESRRRTFPINPKLESIEGVAAYSSLSLLPRVPDAVSIVTPPNITRLVVSEAVNLGVKRLWMQPGAEDSLASQAARNAGLSVIDDGSCILVALSRQRQNR